MKTLVSAFLIIVISQTAFTQEFKNEIKLNPIYLFSLNKIYPEVSYERSISDKSAVGVTLGILIGSKQHFNYIDDFINFDFSVLPYYRYYLGKERTNGFFVEGHSMIFSRESYLEGDSAWGVGFGAAVGVKFEVNSSIRIDLVVGGGFNLNNENDVENSEWNIATFPDVYPRLGLAIAKRF